MLPESLRCQKTRYLMTLEILVWGHEDFKHIIVCMCFVFFLSKQFVLNIHMLGTIQLRIFYS